MATALNAQTPNYKPAKLLRQSKRRGETGWRILMHASSDDLRTGGKAAGNRNAQLLGARFPLRVESVMEPLTHFAGKRKELAVTIEFDRFLRRIKDNLAVMAALEMDLQHALQFVVYVAVQIARNLLERVFTIHEYLTPFKNLA
jgi:hypothetical protein